MQEVSFSELEDKYDLTFQPDYHIRPLPIAAVNGQSIDWVNAMRHSSRIEPCTIQIASLADAYLFVKDGMDGLVLTSDQAVLRESRLFLSMEGKFIEENAAKMIADEDGERAFLDEAVIGFDGAWTNYYHWIIFGLARSRLTVDLANLECPVLVPSYTHRQDQHLRHGSNFKALTYTENVWRDSQSLFGLSNQIRELPEGCYRIKKLIYSWSNKPHPTAITEHPSLYSCFSRLSGLQLAQNPQQASKNNPKDAERPLKICILRKSEPRVPQEISTWLTAWLKMQGVQMVELEKLSLKQQIQLFSQCSHVIAAHGAGLTNLLLTQNKIAVLELNKTFEGETRIRPWFYLLAVNMGHAYWFVNLDDIVEKASLQAGIERFLSSDPAQTNADAEGIPWAAAH